MDPTDLPSSHSCRVNVTRKSSLVGPKVLRTNIGIRISSSLDFLETSFFWSAINAKLDPSIRASNVRYQGLTQSDSALFFDASWQGDPQPRATLIPAASLHGFILRSSRTL